MPTTILTVTDPAENRKLTTVEALERELGVENSTDDEVGDIVDQASAAIETHTRRRFAVESVQETIDPLYRVMAIMLERYPVIAVTAMTLAGVAIDVDEIEVDARSGLLYRLQNGERIAWDCGRAVITYSAGYRLPGEEEDTNNADAEELPADLERAAIKLATMLWHGQGRDASVRAVQYSEGSRVEYGLGAAAASSDGMPTDIAGLLAPYRRPIL
jgi:hypothetical protein